MPALVAARRLWRWAKGRDPLCFEDVELPFLVLGSDYGSHAVYPEPLGSNSVVYSFGVGEDVSFDLALIERWGLQVHAFDPTPRSIEWVSAQGLPPAFRFGPFGIADFDGKGAFHPPTNPDHVSHSLLPRASASAGTAALQVEFRTLKTLMRTLGHSRIDLLKLDIEGSEYSVINQLLSEGIEVDQLLVEYHHQFKNVPPAWTRASISKLRGAGFRVFRIAPTGREFSLIHERRLPR